MPINVLTVTTINDQTFHFPAQSEEKDENGLPEVNNFERLRAVVESENPDATFECTDLDGEPRLVRGSEIAKFSVGHKDQER
ncbi:hypothetical protein [Corynebacterium comes]|nr:hypothetical protein [Corynebacterium comes]